MAGKSGSSAVDATVMRKNNAALVLRLIWNARRISRADLARETGLSASTISDIINDLSDRELVSEQGTGASSGGRRPILLGINPTRAYNVGLEVGAAHVTVVVTTLLGELLTSRRVDNPTRRDPEQTLATAHSLVAGALSEAGVGREQVLGYGVAVPSPVNPEAPGQLSRLILPEWAGVNLAEELSSRYGRPIYIENDANAGALAELWWGEGGVRDLAYVKVATGIGAGFIIDGKLYRGADGSAGEIGHLASDPQGPECICGARGCLTTCIGTEAILRRARDKVFGRDGEPVESLDELMGAIREGDRNARKLIEAVGTSLGAALAGLTNTLNPRRIVLGGEITQLGDMLFDPLRMALRRQALFSSLTRTRIVASRLGINAIAIGATAPVLDAALDDLDAFPAVDARGAA